MFKILVIKFRIKLRLIKNGFGKSSIKQVSGFMDFLT